MVSEEREGEKVALLTPLGRNLLTGRALGATG